MASKYMIIMLKFIIPLCVTNLQEGETNLISASGNSDYFVDN